MVGFSLGGFGGMSSGGYAGTAASSGGGFMSGLGDLFQNKLFLQYLAAAGQDISSGEGIGTNVNKVTQQNISSQNYMKMLQQMLGPDDTKGTVSKDGIKMDIPASVLAGDKGNTMESDQFKVDQNLYQPTTVQPQGGSNFANPFGGSQQGISASDLAGLTPQDISQAMQFKMSQDEFENKKVNEVIEQQYKQFLMNKVEPLDKKFPITVPGIGNVSLRQWNALTKDQQEYAGYVYKAKMMGDEDIMNEKEFKLLEPTEREIFLRSVMADPALKDAAVDLAKAGATKISLGEKLTETKAKSGLKGQLYFDDPKWTGDMNKYLDSDTVQNELFTLESADRDKKTAEFKIKFIEDKITAGGGTVTKAPKFADDGKTVIWTVRWPSGDTRTIKYAIRP